MRDISPKEREVLERVAQHVPVYERLLNPTETLVLDTGCFHCSHSTGTLSIDRTYSTVWFMVPDIDQHPRLGIVIAQTDRFWSSMKYSDPDTYSLFFLKRGTEYPIRDVSDVGLKRVRDLSIYVRLYSHNLEPTKHINRRLGLGEFFNDVPDDYYVEMYYTGAPRWGGVYSDPQYAYFEVNESIGYHCAPIEGIRTIHNEKDLKRCIGKTFFRKSVELKQLGSGPKQRKVGKVTGGISWPPDINSFSVTFDPSDSGNA